LNLRKESALMQQVVILFIYRYKLPCANMLQKGA